VSADIRGGSSGRGHQMRASGVVDDGNFLAILVATSSETSEIRPAVLYDDMLPLSACD